MNNTVLNEFCVFFKITKKTVYDVLKSKEYTKYSSFTVPKKDGTKRQIDSPCLNLKKIQKKISIVLTDKYNNRLEPNIFGFRPKLSIKDNAKFHTNERRSAHRNVIVKFDVANFFPSISYQRIKLLAKKLFHFSNGASNLFAMLTTYQGRLPQGSPCSPIISNLICFRLDHRLMEMSQKAQSKFSRYADDVTFSLNNENHLQDLVTSKNNKWVPSEEILKIFNENGFSLNEKKTIVHFQWQSQRITGIVINEKINLKREYLETIRLIFHQCETNKVKYSNQQLLGHVNYIRFILGETSGYSILYSHRLNELSKKSYFPDSDFRFKPANSKDNFDPIEIAAKKYLGQIKNDVFFGTCFFYQKYIITSKHVIENDGENDFISSFYLDRFINQKPFPTHITIDKAIHFEEMVVIKAKEDCDFSDCTLKISKSTCRKKDKVMTMGYFESVRTCQDPLRYKPDSEIIGKQEERHITFGSLEQKSIYKGMSGGPVLNKRFEVVGVNFSGNLITRDEYNLDNDNLFSLLTIDKLKDMISSLENDKSSETFIEFKDKTKRS